EDEWSPHQRGTAGIRMVACHQPAGDRKRDLYLIAIVPLASRNLGPTTLRSVDLLAANANDQRRGPGGRTDAQREGRRVRCVNGERRGAFTREGSALLEGHRSAV